MKKRYFVYLIYLLFVTLTVTSVSLSKYAITMEDSDVASVARPVFLYEPVSATLNGNNVPDISSGITLTDIMPGDELVYIFRINNFEGGYINQVTLKYMIEVSFDPPSLNLPFTYTLVPAGTYPSAGGDWTYLGFSEEESHSYTLTVYWDEAKEDLIYKNKQQNIEIKVNTQQVD